MDRDLINVTANILSFHAKEKVVKHGPEEPDCLGDDVLPIRSKFKQLPRVTWQMYIKVRSGMQTYELVDVVQKLVNDSEEQSHSFSEETKVAFVGKYK